MSARDGVRQGREPLPVKRDPTHHLVLKVPLYIGEGQVAYVDPVQDALRITLALSRVASLGLLCGEPVASIEDASVPKVDAR